MRIKIRKRTKERLVSLAVSLGVAFVTPSNPLTIVFLPVLFALNLSLYIKD